MKRLIVFLIIILTGLSIFSQNFANMEVFIWDNDDGRAFRNPDNPEKFIGFETNLIKAFEDVGFDTDNKNLTIGSDFPADPSRYAAIFIISGDRPYTDQLFKPETVERMINYLENWHGCLYIEGNNYIHWFAVNGYSDFMKKYFNIVLLNPGDGYAGYDTIKTDTSCTIFRSYEIVYPEGTALDFSVDVFGAAEPDDTFYHSVMVYDAKQKLYKSTAAAYTPPDDKKEIGSKFKTFMSAVDFGGYSAPHRKYEQLPDSIENQLIRTAYLRDIMRLFSIGKILVINHTDKIDNDRIAQALQKNRLEFDYIYVEPGKSGPSFDTYSKYSGVIWYSMNCDMGKNINSFDIDQLSIYMDYGGALLLSGEDIAEQIGNPAKDVEIAFLSHYFGIDYVGENLNDKQHKAEPSNIYGPMGGVDISVAPSGDLFNIWRFSDAEPAFYYKSTTKAPLPSAAINDAPGFEAAFFAFPVENIIDNGALEYFTAITAVDFFDFDTMFAIHTNIEEINVSYTKNINDITFNITLNNPGNGVLKLQRNNDIEETVITSDNQTIYKMTSNYISGLYVIEYSVDGALQTAFSVNISGSGETGERVYMLNNIMYIESESDNSEVEIFDITGQHIDNITVNTKTVWNRYNIMPSGIYFIRFNDSGSVHKILKY